MLFPVLGLVVEVTAKVVRPTRLVFVKCGQCGRNLDTYHEPRPLFQSSPIRVSQIACSKCAE
jgi:hypothetical protein